MIRPLKQSLINLTISYSNVLRNVTLEFNNIYLVLYSMQKISEKLICKCKINLQFTCQKPMIRPPVPKIRPRVQSLCEFRAATRHSAQWQNSPRCRWSLRAHLRHGSAQWHAAEPNGKTAHTVARHSGDVCDLVPVASRSNHGAELKTYGDEKNVCYFAILSEIFPISNLSPHLSIILQTQFSNKFRQLSLIFAIFSPFLWLSLLSTAPKDNVFCESLGDVAFLALKFDILRASCTRVFDMFVEFISVSTCVKCIKNILSVYHDAKQI